MVPENSVGPNALTGSSICLKKKVLLKDDNE